MLNNIDNEINWINKYFEYDLDNITTVHVMLNESLIKKMFAQLWLLEKNVHIFVLIWLVFFANYTENFTIFKFFKLLTRGKFKGFFK